MAAATSAISASPCGRNSCSGGSRSRIVTGSPCMITNSSTKSARCIGSSLASAARRDFSSSARIISRTARMRSSSKNMCSVRQSPMPSAPNFKRHARIGRRVGIGAHAELAHRIGPAHQGRELAGQSRLDHRHAPGQHLAGRAVDGDDVTLPQRAPGGAHGGGGIVDPQRAGAGDARLAHAARHHGGVRGHAAARGEDPFGRVHAVDVLGAGLDPHQDDALALRLERLGVVGREHDLARGRAGRGRKPGGDHLALGVGIDGRVQQLVERGRVDAGHRFLAADQAFIRQLDRDLERRLGGALAGAGLQHPQPALLDRELEILHVAVVLLEARRRCG